MASSVCVYTYVLFYILVVAVYSTLIAKLDIITNKQIFSSSLTGELLLNIICVNEAKQRDKYP